jgi:O-acetyl-ADP-ribose deacetylase (regulator of RNase III)
MINKDFRKLFATILVNAFNCVGVMSKGIELQFKQKFPAEYFNAYKLIYQKGELAIEHSKTKLHLLLTMNYL